MAEQVHAAYGKEVMAVAAVGAFSDWGPSVEIDYQAGRPARIDGTVGNRIAVEIESRVSKQVRGAVLDLICHPYPKKLLVLIPVHMNNADTTASQCSFILSRFLSAEDFRVIVLRGTGTTPQTEKDALIVRLALSELGHRG